MVLSYSEFKARSHKDVDAWVEVYFFDLFAEPLGYLVYRCFPNSKSLPYVLTFSQFIIKLFAAFFFLIGNWVLAPILYLIASVIDSMDGRTARAIYRYDPDLRGMTDYFCDMLSLFAMLSGITVHLMSINNNLASYLMIAQIGATGFFLASTSGRHRIFNLYSYGTDSKLRDTNKKLADNFIMKILFKLQKLAAKIGIAFHPSFTESDFIILIIYPFFAAQTWLIALAVFIMLIDAIAVGALPSYALLLKNKGKQRK